MLGALTERRLSAIILGDVVGYSRLMGIDEVGTMVSLKAHQQKLILPVISIFRGRLVDAAGDAMLIEFGSAVAAVSCAAAIQRGMLARNMAVDPEQHLRFRFGINLGDIVVDGDKIYGDGINVAARLENLCEPGGLCISRSVQEQIRSRLLFPFVDAGEHALKNIEHAVQIFRLSADFIATLPEPVLPTSPPAPPIALAAIKPGTVLNDTYRIDTPIGTGGMGEIFRGHEIHSGGGVAIKVIRPDMMDNKVAAVLFQKEALVLKDINHDAIVRYYSFSFDPTLQRHYLAMEFVDGPALSELVQQGPLTFDAVAALSRRAASGLHKANLRGIVHRDIAPDNIIVPMGDVSLAKVIDFGIARAAFLGASTIIGDGFAGKYNYVAPEQLGLRGGEVTPLSDIYSLGLVLAEANLGQPLDMSGTQAEVLEKRNTVPALNGIDPRLWPLLERMLQPDPARRPRSMQEVADWTPDERRPTVLSGRPAPQSDLMSAVTPVGLSQAQQKQPRIERWIIGTLALTLIVGGGVTFYIRPTPTHADHHSTVANSEPNIEVTPFAGTSESSSSNQTNPVPETLRTTADRIRDYVKGFDGGKCFVAVPVRVTDTTVAIEGFAQDKDKDKDEGPFDPLDAAFRGVFGFEATIDHYPIQLKQCPAVDFLRQVDTSGATAPTLFLKSISVASSHALVGSVRGAVAKHLALLLVQDDGEVVDLTRMLKGDGENMTFDVPLYHGPGSTPLRQLLIAIVSSQSINAPYFAGIPSADRLFPAVLEEAKRRGNTLAASAKWFLLAP